MRKRLRAEVDLNKLRPISLADAIARPTGQFNTGAVAPDLFEQWWAARGDRNWATKHAAREGWYACAESLGVQDDVDKGDCPDV